MPWKPSLWPALMGVLALAGALAAWHISFVRRESARMATLEAENRELRARAEQAARRLQAPPQPQQPAPAIRAEPREMRGEADIENTRLLIQLREKLAAANGSIHALDTRVRELEAAVEKAAEENRRLAASDADLKETLAATNRVLDAVRAELKGKDERLTHLMTTNTRLLEENRAQAGKVAAIPPLLRDLEELNRRREVYLNNLLRRYRDLTEQYRSLAGREDRPDELARIQNAVSMADEDLRQLSSLNAQAARLQQRLK